jgi:hypothetical protein
VIVSGLTIPAHGSLTLSSPPSAPTIQMLDQGNQDACKNATVSLSYTGKAHS